MLKKILFFFVLLSVGFAAYSQNFPPKPNALVTDYTNTLSDGDKQNLENKLVAFDDTSSTQIAIAIIKSVGDYDINDYAARLGRTWGIGQKGKNNGVIILVAMSDHKMAIQVGYGLEGALPDVIAHQIIEDDMKPAFRQNDYYGGLNTATDDLIKYAKGEYKADAKPANDDNNTGGGIFALIIIVVVILIFIFRNRGGGGQIYGGRGGASPFWWFLAGDLLGSSGRGGGWGGGSGGGFGGGGGGGGFGGFGGGSFGGGGASGSW